MIFRHFFQNCEVFYEFSSRLLLDKAAFVLAKEKGTVTPVWAQSCLTCFNSVHAHGVQPPLTARSGRDNYNRYYQCTAGSMLCQENCTSIRHLPPVFASHSLAICKSLTSWLCQLPTRLSGTGFPYARSSPKKPLKPTRRRCRTGTA